jgi:hypothetical protein
MYTRALFSVATLTGLAALNAPASAANYAVNCGTSGPSSLVQNQLAAITGTNNSLTVSGTCVGDVSISGISYLSITGLSMTGTLFIGDAKHISFEGLTLFGTLSSVDHARFFVSDSTVNGYIQLIENSSGQFTNLTSTQWTDPATGAGGSGIACLSGSNCSFSNTTVAGVPSADPATPSIGIQVASASRFNFASGRISGFDWGVHVWNNATAFFNPDCANLSIDSNKSIGVYVRDGGVVKLDGLSPPVSTDCPAAVLISNNGQYGMVTEGGGLGFLYRAQVTGHTTDGVHVQDGSTVKIQSSSIDAATSTGRSARVNSDAHLWFDEEVNGPTASSTLAGPVCVSSDSSIDTNNSATHVRTTSHCPTP